MKLIGKYSKEPEKVEKFKVDGEANQPAAGGVY